MNNYQISTGQLSLQQKQWLNRLTEEIEQSLSQSNFTIEVLLKPMRISRTELYRQIKTLTGLTPYYYIQKLRLKKAHQLIQSNTYNSLRHIVAAVGFKKYSDFRRLYMATYGVDPTSVYQRLWAEKLKSTIQQNLSNASYTVEFLLHDMSLDRKVLYQRTKKVTGLSPGHYIRKLRLERAKVLLEGKSTSSLKSVAKEVGFQRVDYFTKLYKQFIQLPTQ